ncbi:hypothetical protein B0H14DRAFT_3908641, partial [Mycena olivaceomarginata]
QLTSACTPPPFLSAATAALLLYGPNGHHAPSNAACYCFSPSPSFSQFFGAFLANKNDCRARDTPPYGQLSTAILHDTESLSLAPTIAACHAHTHHVRQRPRTSTQPPPPAIHICAGFVWSLRH